MRHIKKLTFTLAGLAFLLVPSIATTIAIWRMPGKDAAPVWALILTGTLMIVVTAIIGVLICNLFEKQLFTAFFLVPLRNRKPIYHDTLGHFELAIDTDEMTGTLVRQGFFVYEEICTFVNIDPDGVMETIKDYLDRMHEDEIKEKEEKRRKMEAVKKLMGKDRYLDAKTRRDHKLTDIGI